MYDYFKFFSVPCYRIQCDVIDLKLQEINSLLCPLMKNWLNEPVFSSSSERFCSAFIKILITGEKYINRYFIFCKMIYIHFTNLYTRDTCQLLFLPIIFLFSNGRGEKESDIASLQLSQQYFKAELECVRVRSGHNVGRFFRSVFQRRERSSWHGDEVLMRERGEKVCLRSDLLTVQIIQNCTCRKGLS